MHMSLYVVIRGCLYIRQGWGIGCGDLGLQVIGGDSESLRGNHSPFQMHHDLFNESPAYELVCCHQGQGQCTDIWGTEWGGQGQCTEWGGWELIRWTQWEGITHLSNASWPLQSCIWACVLSSRLGLVYRAWNRMRLLGPRWTQWEGITFSNASFLIQSWVSCIQEFAIVCCRQSHGWARWLGLRWTVGVLWNASRPH